MWEKRGQKGLLLQIGLEKLPGQEGLTPCVLERSPGKVLTDWTQHIMVPSGGGLDVAEGSG